MPPTRPHRIRESEFRRGGPGADGGQTAARAAVADPFFTSAGSDHSRLASGLFAQFRDWRSRLGNADIGVRRERAFFREPQLLEADPDLALRLFEFVARHGIPPSLETGRRI